MNRSQKRNSWVDIDLQGLRKNSSLPKVIAEMYQNAADTDATNISIDITPDGRGTGKVLVVDNSSTGYLKLSDAYTFGAPSSKAGDDTKRGIFNVGEKEFIAFCVMGRIITMSGNVSFNPDGTRTMGRKSTAQGSIHDFVLRMNRSDQEAMIAKLKDIVIDEGRVVTVNGIRLAWRETMASTKMTLPLHVEDPEDPYRFIVRDRMTGISLHEPTGSGPLLHVLGMPVQEIDCPYSVNVHGRLKLDQARDQVNVKTVAKIMAQVANLLAEQGVLSEDDAQGWAGDTLGKYSTPEAAEAIWKGKFGDDAVVANPADKEANSVAASFGRTVVPGGSLRADQWSAVKRVEGYGSTFAPSTSSEFGTKSGGLLSEAVPEAEWPDDAKRVVTFTRYLFGLVFPGSRLEVEITAGTEAPGCIAAMQTDGRSGRLILNQGHNGWDWFKRENDEEILNTLIHEFAHFDEHGAGHSPAWGYACAKIGAKVALDSGFSW